MNPPPPTKDYATLIRALARAGGESEWVEFKLDFVNPKDIGQYISALANSAALNEQPFGYLIWGVEDGTGKLAGTNFDPHSAKKGNEPLENWLLRLLEPRINFSFHKIDVDGVRIVVAEIERARNIPVRFEGIDYIRVGSVTRPLRQAPERERALWRSFDQVPFEKREISGIMSMSTGEAVNALDAQSYFKLLRLPNVQDSQMAASGLHMDGMLHYSAPEKWSITNLGAILLAHDLRDFPNLQRKAVRVIQYPGKHKLETTREREFHRGYAVEFEQLIDYIEALLPTREVIRDAIREDEPMYPSLAIRELVANMLIHQDLSVTGAGPMVEIFSDRIEITNPGESLVEPARFIDAPPRTRNEAMAAFMRRVGICEERGSGIDKVMQAVELAQLPPPLFETPPGATRAVVFARHDLRRMSRASKVRAVYQHACLRYVMGEKTSNASLRERFGISAQNAAAASRLLGEALKQGVIVIEEPEAGAKSRSYLPYWAAPSGSRGP
ncbi:MAG: transcriptional regulator [Gammaproteobacteria bacterium]|nr:transcriptional regulator [Gammaproteobacteria bacterium]